MIDSSLTCNHNGQPVSYNLGCHILNVSKNLSTGCNKYRLSVSKVAWSINENAEWYPRHLSPDLWMDQQRNLLVRRHSCDKTQGMATKTRVAKRGSSAACRYWEEGQWGGEEEERKDSMRLVGHSRECLPWVGADITLSLTQITCWLWMCYINLGSDISQNWI